MLNRVFGLEFFFIFLSGKRTFYKLTEFLRGELALFRHTADEPVTDLSVTTAIRHFRENGSLFSILGEIDKEGVISFSFPESFVFKSCFHLPPVKRHHACPGIVF